MFLTAEEVADLTGLKRPGAQVQWLRVNGWPVETDASGRPKLLRSVVEARMGSVRAHVEAQPNWEAIGGTP